MFWLRTLLLILALNVSNPGSGFPQSQPVLDPEIVTGLADRLNRKGRTIEITYYRIDDLQGYVNAVIAERPVPNFKNRQKPAVLTVEFSSAAAADTLQTLFKDKYLIFSTDPQHHRITLTRVIPHYIHLRRIAVVGFRKQ